MIGVFLDTETGGLNASKHSIFEIALQIIDLTDGTKLYEYQTVIAQLKTAFDASDPNSLKVNGFTWEEVARGKKKEVVAQDITTLFKKAGVERKKALFICQNPSFDRVFFSQVIDADTQEALNWPYHWLDLASMYWATEIHKKNTPWEKGVSKDTIAKHYNLPQEAKPHRAMNGAAHLILCYKAVVGFPLN